MSSISSSIRARRMGKVDDAQLNNITTIGTVVKHSTTSDTPGASAPGAASIRRVRTLDLRRCVPVIFVLGLVTYLFLTYLVFHVIPLMKNTSTRTRGFVIAAIFVAGTGLLMLNFVLGVFTDPGQVPSSWHFSAVKSCQIADKVSDKKKDGDLRNCKWCSVYKPDRSHHCSMLGNCVLRMDHYCPWICNTVGFRNYKYFLLLLFYSALVLWTIALTMWETVLEDYRNGTAHFLNSVLVLYCWTLSILVGLVITGFLGFHTWLVSNNLTTIEFCERYTPDRIRAKFGIVGKVGLLFLGGGSRGGKDNEKKDETSKFDNGVYQNFCSVLGTSPICWLLPCYGPPGDGLVWINETSKLVKQIQPSFVFVDDSDEDLPVAQGTIVT